MIILSKKAPCKYRYAVYYPYLLLLAINVRQADLYGLLFSIYYPTYLIFSLILHSTKQTTSSGYFQISFSYKKHQFKNQDPSRQTFYRQMCSLHFTISSGRFCRAEQTRSVVSGCQLHCSWLVMVSDP